MELEDLPNPPLRAGPSAVRVAKERCDWVGLAIALARAAVCAAFGEASGVPIVEVDERLNVEVAVRPLIWPLY